METCTTFIGLHEWTTHSFKIFAWIAEAASKGHTSKVENYGESLLHLQKCIDEKIKTIVSKDKKEDLFILKRRVKFLIQLFQKTLL